MPANLTPQYYKAEEVYKAATTTEDKIAALEEMLAIMPKHKGTDHLQADLKKRLSKLRAMPQQKSGAKRIDPFHIEKGGAGRAVLFGPPNSGKSAILAAVTRAHPNIGEYPFTTTGPMPGMMPHNDIQVQLIDLPPVTADFIQPGMMGCVRSADIVLVVLDLDSATLLEDYETCLKHFADRELTLVDHPGPIDLAPEVQTDKPALILCNKCDLDPDGGTFEALKDLEHCTVPMIPISATADIRLDEMKNELIRMLDVVRVYTKLPGKEPDMKDPFVLRRGSTVLDLARQVHRDLPDQLDYARIWGSAKFDGQSVQRDFVLGDRDVAELHS